MPGKKVVRRQLLVALGAIFNEKGEILISRRNDPHNRGVHNKWEFPGGKVEFAEHPSETIVRETKEEVGIIADVENLFNIYNNFHPDRPHIQIVLLFYVLKMRLGQIPIADAKEVKEVRFVTLEKAHTMDLLPGNKAIVRELQKAYNNRRYD